MRRVVDLHAGQKAQLDGRQRHGIGPRYDRLRGNHRGCRGQQNQRRQGKGGDRVEEGVGCHGRVSQNQRALPKVVQDQTREDQNDPCDHDGSAAKMAKIGIKRLGPRHGQKHRAQHYGCQAGVFPQEPHAPHGVECSQHGRVFDDVPQPDAAQHNEPKGGDRPKPKGDVGRALSLHGKQRNQNSQGDRHDPRHKFRHDQSCPLDRRKHRNGGCDHRIAEEQRRPGNAEAQDNQRTAAHGLPSQHVQRQNPTFAPVIGAQQDKDVFDGHDQDQRPDQLRQLAQNMGGLDCVARDRLDRFAKGIDRAGADVAVNHTNGAPNQRRGGLFMWVAWLGWFSVNSA